MFELKRFIAFVAVGLLLIVSRLYPSELAQREYMGKYTAFGANDRPIEFISKASYERLDFEGDDKKAKKFIEDLRAEILFTETPEGVTIYYCYTRKIPKYKLVGHVKVNLVVAVSAGGVSVGSPLLKGSY